MNLFLPNYTVWGDRPGLGTYEVGHFLQHQQYLQVLARHGVFLPDFNIIRMGPGQESDPERFLGDNANEFLTWLNDHETIHELLRQRTNVSGSNLADLDPDSPEQWDIWQQAHAREHAAFDELLGTT